MFRAFYIIFGLYFVTQVWSYDQKMIMIQDENVLCGPITCPLNLTSMCFFTNRVTRDAKNGIYITACGTCVSANGTTVKDSCNTEPTTLTNITNAMAISVTNSSIDPIRMKTGITGLLMSEIAAANAQSPNNNPSAPFTTPPTWYGNAYNPQQASQQPIIVVQPPAQQIYFGSEYTGGSNRPIRSSQQSDCFPNCAQPQLPQAPPSNFRPNDLPPQLNEAYNLAQSMLASATKMMALLQDMSAGLPVPYMNNNNDPSKTPPVKQNFPVFTPDTNFYG